ncbi:MAG: cytochrome ubiquinol oxidase subunit I [Myxococcota bacterium]
MEDLLAARLQMAVSLGFHILFSVVGMAMPTLMVIAEVLHVKTRKTVYLELAHRWAKGTAILFAVGAVSGTVLSFELGLLWPRFMQLAGPLIGLPFTLEGFAFFFEGIFLGIYLYGWNRLHPWAHAASGAIIAISGIFGGAFVVSVNGFMNTPAGFDLVDGRWENLRPWDAFLNPAFPTQALHMVLAAYVSVSFVVLGIHAARLLRAPSNPLHKAALHICFGVAVITTPAIMISGDLSAKHVAERQPLKLAAAEGHFHTTKGASLSIGGWPSREDKTLKGALHIPKALSFLAFADFDAEVKGLEEFPEEEWPPLAPVHLAFQIMVGCGMAIIGLLGLGMLLLWKWRDLAQPWWLRAVAWASPLGLVAVEAGWTVTEVGRQPWIIQGVLRTADAVTPVGGLWLHFVGFTALYLFLGVVVVMLLRAHVTAADDRQEAQP